MRIKKLTFCILCYANAANLAADEDLNDKKTSISTVEENVLINKNDWNTRKWGSIYLLFPHLSLTNIFCKLFKKRLSCGGQLKRRWEKILNFIFSAVIEYKYMFFKCCRINVRLNLNNFEGYPNDSISFFSLEPSLEWIYGRKVKHIFSGSFSPLGFAYVQDEEGSRANDFIKNMWTFGGVLLKYEYDKRFYLNFGKIITTWYSLKDICKKRFRETIAYNLVSIEFGLNIIGVNDWRKKRKENLV